MSEAITRAYREALDPLKGSNRIAAMLISFMDKCTKDEGTSFVHDLDRVIDAIAWVDPPTGQKPTEFK